MSNTQSIYRASLKTLQGVALMTILVYAAAFVGCPEATDMAGDVLQPPTIDPNVDPLPQPVTSPPADPFEGMKRIPASEFRMGSNSGDPDERPVHSVYVDAFYMDKYEVTNAEYAEFLNAKGKHAEAGHTWLNVGADRARIEYVSRVYRVKAGYENHPVTYVSWYGVMAYAAWKGKRLPTEAEWEKAAQGDLAGQKYSWATV